jgi:hypothetical protein
MLQYTSVSTSIHPCTNPDFAPPRFGIDTHSACSSWAPYGTSMRLFHPVMSCSAAPPSIIISIRARVALMLPVETLPSAKAGWLHRCARMQCTCCTRRSADNTEHFTRMYRKYRPVTAVVLQRDDFSGLRSSSAAVHAISGTSRKTTNSSANCLVACIGAQLLM